MHIAKAFAKARQVLDQPLWTFPMHLRLLSTMEVKHRGAMQLAFFTTSLLSFADYGFPELGAFAHLPLPEPGRPTEILLRTLTATTKAIICKGLNSTTPKLPAVAVVPAQAASVVSVAACSGG